MHSEGSSGSLYMERIRWTGKVSAWWMLQFFQLQVLDAVRNGHQAMVFVHSRKDTVKTGRILVWHSDRDGVRFVRRRWIWGIPGLITFVVYIITSLWWKATFALCWYLPSMWFDLYPIIDRLDLQSNPWNLMADLGICRWRLHNAMINWGFLQMFLEYHCMEWWRYGLFTWSLNIDWLCAWCTLAVIEYVVLTFFMPYQSFLTLIPVMVSLWPVTIAAVLHR